MPGPAAKLIEASCIHGATGTVPQGLPLFLYRGCSSRKYEIAADAGLVVCKKHPGSAHGFQNFDAKWAYLHLGTFERRPAGGKKAVLPASLLHYAESTVENAAMRVNRHADTKIPVAIN